MYLYIYYVNGIKRGEPAEGSLTRITYVLIKVNLFKLPYYWSVSGSGENGVTSVIRVYSSLESLALLT